MRTSAVWILLALIACVQAPTSLRLARHITGQVATRMHVNQLDGAAQAVLNPARMVRLAARETTRTESQNTVRARTVLRD